MAIKQLSVFVQNQKGAILPITRILKDNNINLRALSIADTKDYGIIRIIADDTDKALEALNNAGQTAKLTDVVAFAIPDKAGALNDVLTVLSNNDVNIEYMYSLIPKLTEKAYIVIRADDNLKAEEILKKNNIELL